MLDRGMQRKIFYVDHSCKSIKTKTFNETYFLLRLSSKFTLVQNKVYYSIIAHHSLLMATRRIPQYFRNFAKVPQKLKFRSILPSSTNLQMSAQCSRGNGLYKTQIRIIQANLSISKRKGLKKSQHLGVGRGKERLINFGSSKIQIYYVYLSQFINPFLQIFFYTFLFAVQYFISTSFKMKKG